MNKSFITIFLTAIVLISCQTPCEQTYFQQSPEIDLGKKVVDAYLNGNWDVYPNFYADTAKIWRNKSWVTDEGMTAQQLIADLQEGIEPVSEYSMDSQIWDMIITPEGDRWVHLWGVWHGTVEATGKTYDIPVHVSMNIINNKIVRQVDFFNDAEIAMDMMALAAESDLEETSEDETN